MEIAVVAIAGASLVITVISAVVAWRARGDSSRSAAAAEAAEHRASRPHLRIEPDGDVPRDATDIIYRVHNLEGQDLTSVVVHRPILGPGDANVVYPVAVTGSGDWGDSAEIGPIALASYGRFTLKLGSADRLPELRVRVVCSARGGRPWHVPVLLDTPRGPAALQAEIASHERESRARQAADQEALVRGGAVNFRLYGGAAIGTGSSQFQLTTLRISVRNDTEMVASNMRVVVGANDDVVWAPRDDVLPPRQAIDEFVDLHGALRNATPDEAGGRPLQSYPSRLEFTLGGRRFVRRSSGELALV